MPTPTATPTPTPQPQPTLHVADITLRLRKHLKARGTVTVTDTYKPCVADGALVSIFRRKRQTNEGNYWETVGFAHLKDGRYRSRIPDRRGRYSAWLEPVGIDPMNGCISGLAKTVRHKH